MSGAHIHFLLLLRNQIKLYHWSTKQYSRHLATDKILEELDKSIDSFVEVYMGKYGRSRLTSDQACLTLTNLTDPGAKRVIQAAVKHLQGPLTKSLKAQDTDLLNIKDEMVAQLNQLLYLFSL